VQKSNRKTDFRVQSYSPSQPLPGLYLKGSVPCQGATKLHFELPMNFHTQPV